MSQLRAIIIAGGGSRRMGTDKALLPLQGRPLLAHVAAQLLAFCCHIDIAAGTAERAERYKTALVEAGVGHRVTVSSEGRDSSAPGRVIRFVDDRWPGAGPLAGLHAALSEHSPASQAAASDREQTGLSPYALVTACDMPMVSVPLVGRMLEQARVTGADIICVPGQPFHALYHERIAAVIEAMLREGDRRFMRLLARVQTAEVELAAAEAALFEPLNTPEAYWSYVEGLRGHP
ncbi:molybdenum cofactor guanylyltransferase [Paenibacillus sp. 1P07SE]|uniref:molybdenum cofactor guanylyltransferase n=1 Tax=Paenibacillus sp. 1P07SE TaxID=3132209 RepID=UPI0039A53488